MIRIARESVEELSRRAARLRERSQARMSAQQRHAMLVEASTYEEAARVVAAVARPVRR